MPKTPSTRRRGPSKDPRVGIVGGRVKVALEAVGLSVNAAAHALGKQQLARISQSALNSIVLGQTTTTRKSVRDGIARLTEVREDWLSGTGDELTTEQLLVEHQASRRWDWLWDMPLSPDDNARFKRWLAANDEFERILTEVFDLNRWRRLFGHKLPPATHEESVEFAVALARALNVALRNSENTHRVLNSAGMRAIKDLLDHPPALRRREPKPS